MTDRLRRRWRWHNAALGLAILAVGCGGAQEGARTLPEEPLLWAYGADDYASIPQGKHLGLNTLMLELKAPLDPLEKGRAIATIQAAQQYGMQVIVGLPLTLAEQFGASLSSSPYVEAVTDYVREIVPVLGEEPNVIGWATGDYLEKDLRLTDADFHEYLLAKYGSVSQLAEAWGADLSSIAAVTMETAPTLDDELPFSAGRPSVDLADFQALKYREMMEFWAALVRDASGGKGLLFTGRVTLYRSLVSIPDAYDVVIVSMPPDLLEADWDTHNVQALDIARGPRARPVVPCLRLPNPVDHPDFYAQARLREWLMQAALHGAVGASFEAPPDILGNPGVQDQWMESLAWAKGQAAWGCRPRGVGVVLYEPYADGFEALGVPVYGYVKGMSAREPSDLLNAFKAGTRYGAVEYLSASDALREDLDRYSVILAPMALSLPEALQQRLTEYVAEGGVLVADIGAGVAQSGAWDVLPPRLASLFGVPGFVETRSLMGNLTIRQAHGALPSLPSGAQTTGDFQGDQKGRRTGAGRYAVGGWAGFVQLEEGTLPFAQLSMSVTEDKQPTFAGILARDTGRGTALFATHRLWASWLPEHQLFQPFHADLWQRRARVELLDAPFIAPALGINENQDGSVVLYNPARAQRIQVGLYAAEHRLFEGGVCQFSAQLIDETGLRTGAILATVDAPRHSSFALTPTPIEVRPYEGAVSARVEEVSPEAIRATVGGVGSQPAGLVGRLAISAGQPQAVRITIGSGTYPIEPGSRHRVRVAEQGGRVSQETLRADDRGRLILELTAGLAELEITPAA